MKNKISKFVFLILLLLLQSCSGGKIGNFLESSFRNNNSSKISQKDISENKKFDKKSKEQKFLRKQEKIIENQLIEESNPLITDNSSLLTKNDEDKIKKVNQNYQPKSYRIFVILKYVDPSFPTENFSKVLRSGNINFEIERIELIPELNQNKK